MKSASAGTIALLNSGRMFHIADYYTFTLRTGTHLRYTSADVDMLYPDGSFIPFIYSSSGPTIKRGSIKTEIGIKVAKCSLTLGVGPAITVLGVPWPQFVERGGLDGADVLIQRCYMATWGDLNNGLVTLFSGRVSDVQPSRTVIEVEVSSDLELLNINMPRRLYQPGCPRALYDAGCRVNQSDFTATGTVGAGSTKSTIIVVDGASPLSNTSNFYDLGSITMTSGANINAMRTVADHVGSSNTLRIYPPFDETPAVGDTLEVIPGCNKTLDHCQNKFNNIAQFGGFPYVPVPETAV